MNKKPTSYKQYDGRWSSLPYRTSGETSTIGSSGCGPTCAAMVIATLKDAKVTPAETAKWAMEHGYKAYHNGTAWAYFVPQLAEYGITCRQVKYTDAMKLMAQGWYVIAAMGKGLWTTGGHFVLAWWADDVIHICDPASTAAARENGDPALFKAQAVAFWAVDASAYNENGAAVAADYGRRRIDNVKAVQAMLNAEYAAGLDEDGVYGKMTRAAIVTAMQTELGFTGGDVDGIAGKVTCKALPAIRKGSCGVFVKLTQCALVCHGYKESYVDGCAGSGTESAILDFQRKNVLKEDGICWKDTYGKLLNS